MIFQRSATPLPMWEIEKTVSRQIKNTQKLSESQKSARVLTPDSFHRGTSQHGRQSSTGARHAEPILGPSVLLTLSPHPTRTHTTQPTQQKHTRHCRASPPLSQRLHMHARHQRCTRQCTCARTAMPCGCAVLPAQRIAARSIALAETVERSSGTLVDQRRRQVLREPLGGSTTAPGGSRAAISKVNSVLPTKGFEK